MRNIQRRKARAIITDIIMGTAVAQNVPEKKAEPILIESDIVVVGIANNKYIILVQF